MKKNIYLGVNIDHVATLRQARGTRYPDPIQAALVAEEAGADGITIHLREDRRHIQERDVRILKEVILTPMNLEMAVTEAMVSFAEEIKPQQVCLVPEKRQELTTEGGLDVVGQREKIHEVCIRLAKAGIEVSIFIDPTIKQLEAALHCQAPAVEIHTGSYADAIDPTDRLHELQKIQKAAKWAAQEGFIVNAGHGLNYQNVQPIAAIPEVKALNIGHGIIARAVFTSLKDAVSEMKRLMVAAR